MIRPGVIGKIMESGGESDVLLKFADANYTNPNGNRYFWDPINKVLHGPFSANQIAWCTIGGRKKANSYQAVTETTGYTETIAGNWASLGAATLTANQIAAPDANKLADKLTFTASAGDGVLRNLGSATDDTDQTFCIWVLTLSGTKQFRLRFKRKDGTYGQTSNLTATATWQRFDLTTDIAAGAIAPYAAVMNDSGGNAGDIYIWGASVYKDKSHPWPYRTNDTGADQVQAADSLSWPSADIPAQVLSGKWAIKWIPPTTHTYHGANNYMVKMAGILDFYKRAAATVRMQIRDDGVEKVQTAVLTYSPGVVQTDIMDAAEGSIEHIGADTGDGKVINNSWEWSGGNDLLYSSQANCSMSEIYAP